MAERGVIRRFIGTESRSLRFGLPRESSLRMGCGIAKVRLDRVGRSGFLPVQRLDVVLGLGNVLAFTVELDVALKPLGGVGRLASAQPHSSYSALASTACRPSGHAFT